MATYTPRLNLKKPDQEDIVNINDINNNMDVLDGMVLTGSGSPEGAVVAQPGIVYVDTDPNSGSPAWIKRAGTSDTGWEPMGDRMVLTGTGLPQGVVSAGFGVIYVDDTPNSLAPVWIKISGTGNTGWVVMGQGTYIDPDPDLTPYAYTFEYTDENDTRPVGYDTVYWKWAGVGTEEMPLNALPGDWGFIGGKPYFFSDGKWKQPGMSVTFTDADTNLQNRFRYHSTSNYFNPNADKLEKISVDCKNLVTNMSSTFQGCSSLVEVNLEGLSSVTDMSSTFRGCSSLIEVNIEDTSAVTNMSSTFQGCSSLVEVNIEDTSAVTNMTNMFNGCSSLVEVNLEGLNLVTSMYYAFQGCSSLVEVNLEGLNLVTDMNNTFNTTGKIERITMDGFNGVNSSTSTNNTVNLSNNKIGIVAATALFNSIGTRTYSYGAFNLTSNPCVSDPGWAACKAIATGKGYGVTP